MKENTCCFIGNEFFPKKDLRQLIRNMDKEIDTLIENGITEYITGASLGFETMAANCIIIRKAQGLNIRLILSLPYKKQNKNWDEEQKRTYRNIRANADEVVYISKEYHPQWVQHINRYKTEQSAYCIGACADPLSDTAKALRTAKRKGLNVINIAEALYGVKVDYKPKPKPKQYSRYDYLLKSKR